MPRSTVRVDFTDEHDKYLAHYLAKYSPTKENRNGNVLFKNLVANRENQWPWSVHHPWQSWRQRYVKNQVFFDARIAKYQARDATAQKRKGRDSSASVESAGPSKKRVRLEANKGEGPSGRRHGDMQNAKPATTKPREPDVQPSTPQRPSTSADASPARQVAPTEDKPLSAKQVKKRPPEPSEASAPAPSSATKDPGPSSQTRSAPSAPVSTYPRAPPRFVNSFDGQVLVDQKGRVPRALAIDNAEEEEEASEEEIVEVKPQPAKQKKASEPDAEVGNHHAFSQPQATLPPEEDADGERRHPFEMDRGAVIAQFIAEVGVESERGEDAVRNGASPIVPSAPEPRASPAPKSLSEAPSEEDTDGERRHPFELDTHAVDAQFTGDVPTESERPEGAAVNGTSPVKHTVSPSLEARAGPAPKSLKFAAPRPSTASPFGPESPIKAAKPQPQSRVPRTKAARHPALTRIQRQGNNGQEQVHVRSIDFVALSRSSASEKSSRSSHTTVRPPRWSLPGFPRVPWVDERGAASAPESAMGSRSRSGSGSGVASPFRSVLDRDQRTSITFTPSPARSLTADGVRSPALTRVVLHSTDLDLVCAHGLASFLAHMAANHGLALSVVEEVYGRLGSLAAADEVLKGMREAAQGFGEREIERRLRGGVERDEDEYLPPETSRAAMWKRREMQRAQEELAVEVELAEEQHDFSRVERDETEALVEHLPAQVLQRRIGRAEFRREIVKRFV